MNVKLMRLFVALVLSVGVCVPGFSATADEAVAYYSTADSYNCRPPAQAFINNINATTKRGESAGYVSYFDGSNDSYWDANDIAFVCAHGQQWLFGLGNGTVYLDYLSDGWGDTDLEWAILYSCLVVASPLETGSWSQPWIVESSDVFDGLHIVNGFRTSSYVAPAVNVTIDYCNRINSGGYILESWFDAIFAYGYYWTQYDKGCSVYYGSCEYDTLSSFASDPSATQTSDFHCQYIN
jgi:hypothetical protein